MVTHVYRGEQSQLCLALHWKIDGFQFWHGAYRSLTHRVCNSQSFRPRSLSARPRSRIRDWRQDMYLSGDIDAYCSVMWSLLPSDHQRSLRNHNGTSMTSIMHAHATSKWRSNGAVTRHHFVSLSCHFFILEAQMSRPICDPHSQDNVGCFDACFICVKV